VTNAEAVRSVGSQYRGNPCYASAIMGLGGAPFACRAGLIVWPRYTVSQKNKTLNSYPQLPQMFTDFQNAFTGDSAVNLQQAHI